MGGFGGSGSIFSPIPSLSALSSTSGSPAQWQTMAEREGEFEKTVTTLEPPKSSNGKNDSSNGDMQTTTSVIPLTSSDEQGQAVARKLLGENERSALEAFFSEQLSSSSGPTTTGAAVDVAHIKAEGRDASENMTASPRLNVIASNTTEEEQSTIGRGRQRGKLKPGSTARLGGEDGATSPAETSANLAQTAERAESPTKKPRLNGMPRFTASSGSSTVTTKPSTPLSGTGTSTPAYPKATVSTAAASTSAANGNGKRVMHVASEQRRRMTIKDNYKALVDLLLAGEEISGISLLNNGTNDDPDGDAANGGGAAGEGAPKKSKPKGRGRGRKGQDGAGATKSAVLERAADYLRWLERGNAELDKEIARVESILSQ